MTVKSELNKKALGAARKRIERMMHQKGYAGRGRLVIHGMGGMPQLTAGEVAEEVVRAYLGGPPADEMLARVKQLEEALREARDFIADEYRDPSRGPAGDWIAKEARPVFDNICTALGEANAPR